MLRGKNKLCISQMEKVVATMIFTLSFSLARAASVEKAEHPLDVDELPWTFYESTCPQLEPMVQKQIKFHLKKEYISRITHGLLCLHFHDCFVQGCDAWILLDGSANRRSEAQESPPNLTQQIKAFEMINETKARLDEACRILSCSDIAHLAAPDFVSDSETSVGTMDEMFKGRRLQQEDHRSKREPPKPPLDRGHDGQHN